MVKIIFFLAFIAYLIFKINDYLKRRKVIDKERELSEMEIASDAIDVERSIAEEAIYQEKVKRKIDALKRKQIQRKEGKK